TERGRMQGESRHHACAVLTGTRLSWVPREAESTPYCERLECGKVEHPSRHKAHEEQPPAAARARRFAAKNAPAGQRQIRKISVRSVRAGHWDDYVPAPACASGS